MSTKDFDTVTDPDPDESYSIFDKNNEADEDAPENLVKEDNRKICVIRVAIAILLVACVILASVAIFFFARNAEQQAFRTSFDGVSSRIVER